jgi:hypothetical protein
MTKKNIFLIAIVLLLGGVYVYFFSDWFVSEDIQIAHTVRQQHITKRARGGRPATTETVYAVSFGLNGKHKLTSVKVVVVSDAETNKYPHAIWNLVTDSNSVPTKAFVYGRTIAGMRPAVKGAEADPLQPNVKYRLLLQAGSLKGEHDFQMGRR